MIKKVILGIIAIGLLMYCIVFALVRNPIISTKESTSPETSISQNNLKSHVNFLTDITPSRNAHNIESLNKARDYIVKEMSNYSCELELQNYTVDENEYTNVICSFGAQFSETVILGAHYDVHYDNNPGADDNASGVAGILEVARLLSESNQQLKHRIDIIAYTLEELPHFKSDSMGSRVHAKNMKQTNRDIKLMISAEMIGYFSDEKNSQKFPIPGMNLLYPTTADFIAVIGRFQDRQPVRQVKKHLSTGSDIDVYSLNAPSKLQEITFSDHASYWGEGFDAVMVTDTSFMRNQNYHEPTDTVDTLDFTRMTEVTRGLYHVVTKIEK